MTQVRLTTIVLGQDTSDADGDMFLIEDIEGMGTPDIDLKRTDRSGDGSLIDRLRVGPRDINIKGVAWNKNNVDGSAFRLRQKIADAFVPYILGNNNLYLDMPSGMRSFFMIARAGGALHFDKPEGNIQRFEIPFTSEDPRLSSQTISASGVLTSSSSTSARTLVNLGNYPVPCVAQLTATATNPFVENATYGGRLTLLGSVGGGTEVNFASKEMNVAGQGFVDIAAVPRQWWMLQPGANVVNVSGSWILSWRNGWV